MFRTIKSSLALVIALSLLSAGCKSGSVAAENRGTGSSDLLQFLRGLVGASAKPPPEPLPVEALARYAEGLSHDSDKEYDLALEAYRKAALADPSYAPLVTEVAQRSLVLGNTAQAIEVLLKATQLPAATASLHAWLAVAYRQDGSTNLADAEALKAIAKAAGSPAEFQNLAEIYLQNNRVADALAALDQATKVASNDAGQLVDLAELYSQIGRWDSPEGDSTKERVKRTLDRASSLNPKAPAVIEKLGDRYFLIEEYEKAGQAYSRLLELNPELPLVRARLIDIYDHTKEYDKVFEQLEALSKEDPKDPQPFLMLGSLAMEQADDKNTSGEKAKAKLNVAIHYFKKVNEMLPDFAPVYYQIALAQIKLGSADAAAEALQLLEKVRAKFRPNTLLEIYTAFASDGVGNEKAAVDHYTVAYNAERARLGFTNEINYWIGEQNEQLIGNIVVAARYFQKSLAINPNNSRVNNYLGYMWAEHGTNLQEAKVLIERAVAAEPTEAMYLDSMAWVLFQLKQPKEALPHMLKAIENLKEPDPVIYDHLGDIQAALKDFAKAKDAYTKPMELEPSDDIKKKLDSLPKTPNTPKS